MVFCFVAAVVYHAPVYRLLRRKRGGREVNDRLRRIAGRRILHPARVTAALVSLSVLFVNSYTYLRFREETGQILLGPIQSVDHTRTILLGIGVQVLITLFAYFQQHHRVKIDYYHYIFDGDELTARPQRMTRSSIKAQIWWANLLTTMLPLVLVVLYLYVFISVSDSSTYTQDQLTALWSLHLPA